MARFFGEKKSNLNRIEFRFKSYTKLSFSSKLSLQLLLFLLDRVVIMYQDSCMNREKKCKSMQHITAVYVKFIITFCVSTL